MAYDRLGRVVSETSAGVTHASTWDKGGNRLTVAYGGTGRVLTSTYDKLQRLDTLSEKLPAETTPRLTSYAENGNVTGKTHPNGTAESTTPSTGAWSTRSPPELQELSGTLTKSLSSNGVCFSDISPSSATSAWPTTAWAGSFPKPPPGSPTPATGTKAATA